MDFMNSIEPYHVLVVFFQVADFLSKSTLSYYVPQYPIHDTYIYMKQLA